MTINVACNQCSTDDGEENIAYLMQLDGPLYFNPDTKSQTQVYECDNCGQSVTVIVEVADDTRPVTVRRDK